MKIDNVSILITIGVLILAAVAVAIQREQNPPHQQESDADNNSIQTINLTNASTVASLAPAVNESPNTSENATTDSVADVPLAPESNQSTKRPSDEVIDINGNETSPVSNAVSNSSPNTESHRNESVPVTSNVIVLQDFETSLEGWKQQFTPEATTSNERARSGNYSLKAVSRLSGVILDLKLPQTRAEYHCYFYDNYETNEGARCAVSLSEAINTEITTSVGVNTQISQHFYVVHAPDGKSWIITEIPRSRGWHHAVINSDNNFHRIYIDDRIVAKMANFAPWTHVFAFMEDLPGTPAPAYFDNLSVSS